RVRQEPALEVVHEVRVRVAQLGTVAPQHDLLVNGLAVLLACDASLFPHEPENDVPSSDGGGTPHEGVEMIGRGDQSREHRALRERQIARIDADVGPGRGLDPVGPLTEVHRVQVPREDLKLREPVLELPCQERLVDLPAEALSVAGVQTLHELLAEIRSLLALAWHQTTSHL